ncbi:MAG: prepilin-type cleavage/methylation domain-containing protein [Deltaproteobacteria bacterium]|nr:MAG: prepilin-type cleavage/methylation domain-containing protein [Deltaproteobacteria bacterium]
MRDFVWTEQRQGGFTLVELMVVIAVIAILAATAVPAMVNWLPGYRLKKAARDLYGNMQLAKVTAIRNNADCAIVFSAGTDEYFVCSDSGADSTWSTVADNTVLKRMSLSDLPSGIRYGWGNATTNATSGGGALPGDNISFNNNVLVFNSRGICNSGYAYIDNSENMSFAVGTIASGVILIREWHEASKTWD